MSDQPLFRLEGVGKEFDGPAEKVVVLKRIDLTLQRGDSAAVIGASGSGKSTLLHLMGGLDTADKGAITFLGTDLATLSQEKRAVFRNKEIGFVFQFHHLLPEFTAVENVAMPGIIAGMQRKEALARAETALEAVGLADRRNHYAPTMSGGERQRTAIARAVLMRPKALLADEPTGNLDEKSAGKAVDLMFELNDLYDMTLVVVTHNLELAAGMDRRYELRSGELHEHVAG